MEDGTTIDSAGHGHEPEAPKGLLESFADEQIRKHAAESGGQGGNEGVPKPTRGLAGTATPLPRLTPEELRRRAKLMQDMIDAQGDSIRPSVSTRDDAGNVLPSWLVETMRKNR